jgi:putative ABC transport system permease protein
METFIQDLRYGMRSLIKNPGFAAVAIITLALGIGANTAIFSVVNAVLLQAMPYGDPDKLVMVWGTDPNLGDDPDNMFPVVPADYYDWNTQNTVFEQIAASRDTQFSLTGMGDPELLVGYRFSSNFFQVAGVKPILGRTFTPEEDRPGSDRVVVLSHHLWMRLFNGDREVLGKTMILSGNPYEIIGVMQPGFRHPRGVAELWTPLALPADAATNRQASVCRVLARLKPNITIEQAQAEMGTLAARLAQENPGTNTSPGVKLISLREGQVGDVRPALLLLLGAVSFVLLIACANIANLLLARATARQKEIAVRTALGANRLRLFRQFLTESLLLSVIGGALGLLLAVWSTGPMLRMFPNNIENISIPKVEAIPIDWRVLLFTLGAALLTGFIFGIVPALQASKADINLALKESGRTTSGGGSRLRNALVVSEIALSLMLLIGAGLLLKSFSELQRSNFGFKTDNVLTVQVILPQQKYSEPAKRLQFLNDSLQRIESLPGVQSVGATNFLPLTGFWGTATFTVEGQPLPEPGKEPVADNRIATPGYFRTMGIRLVEGREFTEQDRDGAKKVAITNETLARKLWPGESPIGKRVNWGDANQPEMWEIVGVVGDIKSFGLEKETHSDVFRPFAQVPFPLMAFTIRTSGDPMSLAAAVRQEIWSVDKDQPMFKVLSLEQLAAESVSLRRVSLILLGIFAALALIIAAVGIYGVMSYTVNERTNEIGIRLALGAKASDVLKLIVGQGSLLTLLGVGIGLVAAFILSRLIANLLYGVSPTDTLILISAPLISAFVALLASYIPARRAMKIDPMVALRNE